MVPRLLAVLACLTFTACAATPGQGPQKAKVMSVQKDKMILQTKQEFFFLNFDAKQDMRKLVKKGDTVTLVQKSGSKDIASVKLPNGTRIWLD